MSGLPMREWSRLLVVGWTVSLAWGCVDRQPVEPERPGTKEQPVQSVPAYRVTPPAGKLPWPQHAPSFTQAEYDAMMARLHIPNNFGLYQSGTTRESMYLHSGLDITLPNGTPIHAVEAGTVRYVERGREFYRWVIVEDADAPGEAWGYVHVDSFRVDVGDRVAAGQLLATVRFQGLEHLHLSRYLLPPGGRWDRVGTLHYVQPDTFFHYRDSQPPVFAVDPVRYFPNDQDTPFPPGRPTVVSGDVDIVVGVRDPGEHATGGPTTGRSAPTDNRLAVSRLEYDLVGPGGDTLRLKSWDFGRLALGPRERAGADQHQAETVSRYYPLMFSGTAPPWWETKISFYNLTNIPPQGRTGVFDPADRALAWRTAGRDAAGRPRFSNGDYVLTVRAYDFKGNLAATSDTVRVRN